MGPLPKRRYPKARQGDRQSHLGIVPPTLVDCPQCHNKKQAHRACPTCGTYDGREVIAVETPKKKTT